MIFPSLLKGKGGNMKLQDRQRARMAKAGGGLNCPDQRNLLHGLVRHESNP